MRRILGDVAAVLIGVLIGLAIVAGVAYWLLSILFDGVGDEPGSGGKQSSAAVAGAVSGSGLSPYAEHLA